ncbi:MAG: alanine--tRNA ligase, partial [Candidatus Thermoplasmatota archaeon]|nr:alanine--tRNA ligase [Candidatus Thermoplasmatota archaeon]
VPPPANPLVISQPCIRLNDLEEVGHSGRHLTMFEMMGHHAFNKNIDEIYWKEATVHYCDEYFRTRIGIPRDVINYKEHLWIGGGNAGPCIEVLAGGLEIATLVFMNMKQDPTGTIPIEGIQYTQNPLNIVDTGYGLERIAWATQGTQTIYETVLPSIVSYLINNTNSQSKSEIYALADHTRCLAFMLGDGIVPSNVKSGYLARLIIRRALRFIEYLKLKTPLHELVAMQLEILKTDFPSLSDEQHNIETILDLETNRYHDTLTKGEFMVKRILTENHTIDTQTLITLYDTHGMPPTIVQNIAEQEGHSIKIPENFDSMIAELHSHEQPQDTIEDTPQDLPETNALYYQDHYIKNFDAAIIWTKPTPKGYKVILDQTAFYPDGGGQPGDIGTLNYNNETIPVTMVEKQGKAIIHHITKNISKGTHIHGSIDWDHRYTLMKHHTGTHLVNGALRKILGEHIWQAGSQLGIQDARFDYAHYRSLTKDECHQIEDLANPFITQAVPVHKKILTRNEAERSYGFRLYQGGVPPGNNIRVLDIPGIDVEACGGTHLNNTQEVEKIRIIKTERIQDGVNRIIFAAGQKVDEYHQEEQTLYETVIQQLKEHYCIQNHEHISEQLHTASTLFSVPITQLERTITRFLKEITPQKTQHTVHNLSEAVNHLFNTWKQQQKEKKQVSNEELNTLKSLAVPIPGTSYHLIIGTTNQDPTTTAGAIISEPNYIVHLSDGTKITSAASENVNIDLRTIAPKIGNLLGGSGGGKQRLTQAGGPNRDNIAEALNIARKATFEYYKK